MHIAVCSARGVYNVHHEPRSLHLLHTASAYCTALWWAVQCILATMSPVDCNYITQCRAVHCEVRSARAVYTVHQMPRSVRLQNRFRTHCNVRCACSVNGAPGAPLRALRVHSTCTMQCLVRVQCILLTRCTVECAHIAQCSAHEQ